MSDQAIVCVVAVSTSAWNSNAVIASSTPDSRYVPEIILRRPMVSNRWPSSSGPSRLPAAKAMKYSGIRPSGTP